MQKLRILISHTSIYKKAGWGRIFPLAVGLARDGNDVTIITTNPAFSILPKRLVTSNVKIIIFPEIIPSRISRLGFGFLSLVFKIGFVLYHKFDIVHSDNGHRPLAGIPCRLSKRLFGSVYIAEWYDWYGVGGQYDNKKKLFKAILGRYELKSEITDKKIADGVVVLSEVLRNRAMQFREAADVIKIHGGADVASIPFLLDNRAMKEKHGINPDILTLGYISSDNYRLAEIEPLIKTIVKYNLSLKIKLLFFGNANIDSHSLPKEILENSIFNGWIDYVSDYEKLQCVDVFFLFKEEILGNKAGWPNCIGDYLACGRPVLLNPVGEVVDFAKQFPSGFIVTSTMVDDIYYSLKSILDNPNQLIDRRPTIRKLAEEEVSWGKKSADLYEFYMFQLKRKVDKKRMSK